MNKKCLFDCANCGKESGEDICKIAAADGIKKKIEQDDEVPAVCVAKGYYKKKKYRTEGSLL